jgi:hypothetical protein
MIARRAQGTHGRRFGLPWGMMCCRVLSADMKHALPFLFAAALLPLASAGAWAAASFEGHYESDCAKIADEFFTRDVMRVGPGTKTLKVRYAKAMYGADGCKPADLLGLLELPEGTWKLEGQQDLGGRSVQRVAVVIPQGTLQVTHARPGHVEETSHAWLIKTYTGEKVTVEKEGAMSSDLDLRWLSPEGLLHVGQPMAPRGKDGYLTELDLDNPLRKLATPSYASPATK